MEANSMTTSDYLESLQDDLSRTITALDLEDGTNFTDIADMAENGDIGTGGGTSVDISSLSSINDSTKNVYADIENKFNSIINNYDVYYDEPVTIYSPNNYFKYIVQLKANGKYRIVWLNGDTDLLKINNSPSTTTCNLAISYANIVGLSNLKSTNVNIITDNEVSTQISNDFDTIEELFLALQEQNQANISYSDITNRLFNGTLLYTNLVVFDNTNTLLPQQTRII